MKEKSQFNVSQHVSFLNLPKVLNEIFQGELWQGIALLNELLSFYNRDEKEVKTLIKDNKNI